jgi:hypothetical protein
MNDLPTVVQLIAAVGIFIAVGAVCASPMLLASWADDQQYKFEQEVIRQSEIARKVAIAEAAIEARKRGEKFVPPDDYAR